MTSDLVPQDLALVEQRQGEIAAIEAKEDSLVQVVAGLKSELERSVNHLVQYRGSAAGEQALRATIAERRKQIQIVESKTRELQARRLQLEQEALSGFFQFRRGVHPDNEAIVEVGDALGVDPREFSGYQQVSPQTVAIDAARHAIALQQQQEDVRDQQLASLRSEMTELRNENQRRIAALESEIASLRQRDAEKEAALEAERERASQLAKQEREVSRQLRATSRGEREEEQRYRHRIQQVIQEVRQLQGDRATALREGRTPEAIDEPYARLMETAARILEAEVASGERPMSNTRYFFEIVEELLRTPDFAQQFGING